MQYKYVAVMHTLAGGCDIPHYVVMHTMLCL
jgi:hypothetical protein